MSLKITLEDVSKIGDGIWRAILQPNELRQLAGQYNNYGEFSIVLLTESACYEATNKTLQFSLASSHILNIGNSSTTIIIASTTGSSHNSDGIHKSSGSDDVSASISSDRVFLTRLDDYHNPQLTELGSKFLAEVRKHFPGELRYHDTSQKYVESPNNFWTVKIQPRDTSLRITVRGNPETFVRTDTIELRPDMKGYSSFKINQVSQISEALVILRKASNR